MSKRRTWTSRARVTLPQDAAAVVARLPFLFFFQSSLVAPLIPDFSISFIIRDKLRSGWRIGCADTATPVTVGDPAYT